MTSNNWPDPYSRPWEQELLKLYPGLFAAAFRPGSEAPLVEGIETADGWRWIVEAVCEVLAAHAVEGRHEVTFSQIKEKLGELRVYLTVGDDYTFAVCDAAERMSKFICQRCGNPGVLRGPGWYHTSCDAHADGDRPVAPSWSDVEFEGCHPDQLTKITSAIRGMSEHTAITSTMVIETVAVCRDPERMQPSPGCPLIVDVNLNELGLPVFQFESSDTEVPIDVRAAMDLARAYAGLRR